MKATLPNNTFGQILFLFILILWAATIFVVPLWVISMFAPWWVALPSSLLVAFVVFVCTVKFKD